MWMHSMLTEIKKNQTLLDFATQNGGAVSELFNVAVANGTGITDSVAAGTELAVETAQKRTSQFYQNNELDITTNEANVQGGIGYMQIGTNFIVS